MWEDLLEPMAAWKLCQHLTFSTCSAAWIRTNKPDVASLAGRHPSLMLWVAWLVVNVKLAMTARVQKPNHNKSSLEETGSYDA